MASEIEKIRQKYLILQDIVKFSNEKIQQAIDDATVIAGLDGLEGEVLNLGVRHLSTYNLLLDPGMVKKGDQKEEKTEKFDTDPTQEELKSYKNLVAKNKEITGNGNSFFYSFSS